MWDFFPRQYFLRYPDANHIVILIAPLSTALQTAIERVLSPLARLLIGSGVAYSSAAELMKSAMVREADSRLSEGALRASDSRLSIATGIHRKDIKRLRDMPHEDRAPLQGPIPAQVIAKWLGDPRLRVKGRPPKSLPKKKNKADELDFDDLVRSVSTDIRPRAVLDELLERGIVTLGADDRLQLNVEQLNRQQDNDSMAEYLGMNVHDHFSVAVDNLLHPQSPQLERCVHYHGLSGAAADKLAKLAEREAMKTLLKLNAEAQKLIADERNHGPVRINFGTYFYRGSSSSQREVPGERP